MTRNLGRGKYDRAVTAAERRTHRIEAVLDAATEVFANRGYAQTRVEDIVEAAGISRRTLYEDFASVEAILAAVYDRAVRINFTTIFERLTQTADPIERVLVGLTTYFEMIAGNPAAARVVFEEYRQAGAEQAARYELNTSRYVTLMLEFLTAAHVAGRLARAPDEVSVYALIKGIDAVAIRALHRGEHVQLPLLAPQMAKLIVDAFGGAR
jgi:AcrR family transcriptional regulator